MASEDLLREAIADEPPPQNIHLQGGSADLAAQAYLAEGRGEWQDQRLPAAERAQDIMHTHVLARRPWSEARAKLREHLPGADTAALESHYGRQLNMAEARDRAQTWEESPGGFLGRRSIPYVSAIVTAAETERYAAARRRFEEGKPEEGDYDRIATYEQMQENNANRDLGGQIRSGLAGIPAMVGEAYTGGRALTALGRIRLVGQAEMAAGRLAAGTARLGAQTATMPSMYLPDAARRAAERREDSSLFAVRNLAPAFAMGALNTAVLGRLSNVASDVPGATLGAYLRRGATRVGTGLLEQQGVDVLASAAGLETGYGVLGDLAQGKVGDALKHLTVQAVTFAAFSALHEGQHAPITEGYANALRQYARRGDPRQVAEGELGEVSQQHARNVAEGRTRSQALELVDQMPPGPAREYAHTLANELPRRLPQIQEQAQAQQQQDQERQHLQPFLDDAQAAPHVQAEFWRRFNESGREAALSYLEEERVNPSSPGGGSELPPPGRFPQPSGPGEREARPGIGAPPPPQAPTEGAPLPPPGQFPPTEGPGAREQRPGIGAPPPFTPLSAEQRLQARHDAAMSAVGEAKDAYMAVRDRRRQGMGKKGDVKAAKEAVDSARERYEAAAKALEEHQASQAVPAETGHGPIQPPEGAWRSYDTPFTEHPEGGAAFRGRDGREYRIEGKEFPLEGELASRRDADLPHDYAQHRIEVTVHGPDGKEAGHVHFYSRPDGTWEGEGVHVEEGHRRNRVAGAMYDYLAHSGAVITPRKGQTPEGKAMWARNREQARTAGETPTPPTVPEGPRTASEPPGGPEPAQTAPTRPQQSLERVIQRWRSGARVPLEEAQGALREIATEHGLSDRDQRVLTGRLEGRSYDDIGGDHKLSRQRIQQIEKAALAKLGVEAGTIESLVVTPERLDRALDLLERGGRVSPGELSADPRETAKKARERITRHDRIDAEIGRLVEEYQREAEQAGGTLPPEREQHYADELSRLGRELAGPGAAAEGPTEGRTGEPAQRGAVEPTPVQRQGAGELPEGSPPAEVPPPRPGGEQVQGRGAGQGPVAGAAVAETHGAPNAPAAAKRSEAGRDQLKALARGFSKAELKDLQAAVKGKGVAGLEGWMARGDALAYAQAYAATLPPPKEPKAKEAKAPARRPGETDYAYENRVRRETGAQTLADVVRERGGLDPTSSSVTKDLEGVSGKDLEGLRGIFGDFLFRDAKGRKGRNHADNLAQELITDGLLPPAPAHMTDAEWMIHQLADHFLVEGSGWLEQETRRQQSAHFQEQLRNEIGRDNPGWSQEEVDRHIAEIVQAGEREGSTRPAAEVLDEALRDEAARRDIWGDEAAPAHEAAAGQPPAGEPPGGRAPSAGEPVAFAGQPGGSRRPDVDRLFAHNAIWESATPVQRENLRRHVEHMERQGQTAQEAVDWIKSEATDAGHYFGMYGQPEDLKSLSGAPSAGEFDPHADAPFRAERQRRTGIVDHLSDGFGRFLADEGGYFSPGEFADSARQLWDKIKRGVAHVGMSMKELAGRMAPRTTAASEAAGTAISRFNAAPAHARWAASEQIDLVMGRNATPQQRLEAGGAVAELRLRYMRKAFQEDARNAGNAVLAANQSGNKAAARQYAREATEAMNKALDVATTIGKPGAAFADEQTFQQFIGNAPLRTPQEINAALQAPNLREITANWNRHMRPLQEEAFKRAEGMDQNDPINARTQLPDFPFTLHRATEADAGKPGVVITGGGRGNLRNVKLGKLGAALEAKGTAEAYVTDLGGIIEQTLAQRLPLAAKAEMMRTLVSEGLAAWHGPGDKPAEGWRKLPDVKPPKGTQEALAGQVDLHVDPRAYDEVRRALAPDEPTRFQTMAAVNGLLTKATLASTVEAAYHSKNLLTMLFKPGVSVVDFFKNVYGVLKDTPGMKERLVELARIGALKETSHMESGMLWGGKTDPTAWMGKFLDVMQRAMRLTADQAFDRLARGAIRFPFFDVETGKPRVMDTETGRRDFINQLGQYNKRAQHKLVALLRDTGLGPFATAGTNYYAQSLMSLVASPGAKATSKLQAAGLRAEMLAKMAAVVIAAPLANYFLSGNVNGDDNTPFGALRLGTSPEGRTSYLDLTNLVGLTRGARQTGLLDIIQGAHVGRTPGQIADRASENIIHSLLHPAVGPPVQFAYTVATGKDAMGRTVAGKPGEGGSQAWNNLVAALQNANPVVGALTGGQEGRRETSMGERAGLLLGPYRPRSQSALDRFNERFYALQGQRAQFQEQRRMGRAFPQERQFQLFEAHHRAIMQLEHAAQGQALVGGSLRQGTRPSEDRVREIRTRQVELARRALEAAR